ncbi:MAG: peptidoglycan binding protein, partial [uncultured bacterium]
MYLKNFFKVFPLLFSGFLIVGLSFNVFAKQQEDSKVVFEKILQKGIVEKETLKAFDGIKKIYGENNHTLWNNRAAADFIKWLPKISEDGLNPHFYHLEKMKDFAKKGNEDATKIKLDILLTDAALTLASNLAFGINITDEQKYNWYKKEQMASLLPAVLKAIENKTAPQYLESLTPKDPRYVNLAKALQKYKKMAHKEDWVIITKGPKMEEGVEDIRVRSLRKRLIAEGYLENKEVKNPGLFDGKLKEALMAFQQEHSLEPDGLAGALTVEALNVTLNQRIKQICVSLDRLREILPQLPGHYLLVDIPAFRLWVYEKNNDVLT